MTVGKDKRMFARATSDAPTGEGQAPYGAVRHSVIAASCPMRRDVGAQTWQLGAHDYAGRSARRHGGVTIDRIRTICTNTGTLRACPVECVTQATAANVPALATGRVTSIPR